MRSYRYLHLDVFTDRLFGGNQLAVFLDGRGLASTAMQAIAKEVMTSSRWPGHPTVGTTFALARAGVVGPEVTPLTLGLGVGPTPVSLVWREDELRFVWMTQLAPTFGEPIGDVGAAAAALRLPAANVADTRLPVQSVSCGVPFLFVPLATRRAVYSASLDTGVWETAGLDRLPVFLFSTESGDDKATVYSRMFAPGSGIPEDPATGGASGPLGCYLVKNKVVTPEKAGAMLSLQGVKMGRPSYIHIAITVERNEITRVRVGGEAVIAGEGVLYL